MAFLAKPGVIVAFVLGFLVAIGLVVGTVVGYNKTHGNIPSNVAYTRLKCGVPVSACNVTRPADGTCTVCPFQVSDTSRVVECATFNFTDCPRLGTYLSFRFQIDLNSLNIYFMPDNV